MKDINLVQSICFQTNKEYLLKKCFKKISDILSNITLKKNCLSGKNILIIEDNNCDQEFISRTIIKAGGKTVIAYDGERGLRSAIDTNPDLIILDYFLPGDNGLEICQKLKKNQITKHIPILFVTVNQSANDMVECISVGAHGYIQKPVNGATLISEVKYTLDNPNI